MKQIILLSLLSFGIAGFASAQTTTLSSTRAHTAKAHMIRGTGAKHKKPTHFSKVKSSKSTSVNISTLNNRKIYNWSNGQRSTPTGEEAAPVNGDQFLSLKKGDSKPQVKKPVKNN